MPPALVFSIRCAGWLVAACIGAAATHASPIEKPRAAPSSSSEMRPLPPASIDDKLVIEGEDLRAREVDTRLTVEVRINGRGPYNFLVDSGADTSVIGLRIAQSLQLPLGTPVILNNMTDRNVVDRVQVDHLSLGTTDVRNLALPALREQDLGGAGIIGIDALALQRLMIDFEKRLVRVEDASRPAKFVAGEIVVTARRKRGQLILTRVRAGGLLLDAVIDTGSQISIGNNALYRALARRRKDEFRTVTATGVTGTSIDLQTAQLPELRFGSITLRNVPIAFGDLPPFAVFGLSDRPALLLGTDVLKVFRRLSLDFRSRKVRFQLRRCTPQSLAINAERRSVRTRISSTGGAEVCGP